MGYKKTKVCKILWFWGFASNFKDWHITKLDIIYGPTIRQSCQSSIGDTNINQGGSTIRQSRYFRCFKIKMFLLTMIMMKFHLNVQILTHLKNLNFTDIDCFPVTF